MRLLYLAKFSYINKQDNGVLKKIKSQIKALKNQGVAVCLISTDYEFLYIDGIKIKKYSNIYIAKIYWIKDAIDFCINKNKNYDIFYIRNSSVDFGLINGLKKIKNKKILLEIPTYPYDKEKKMDSIKNIITIILDRIFRQDLKKYIYKVVTYSKDKEIFGIPCLNISNGIDLNTITCIKSNNLINKTIIFTVVSNCSLWHGIDRFIYSLKEYIKEEQLYDVLFNIVGEGEQLEKLKNIVENNICLKKRVIFHGFLEGEKLNNIYDMTNIAVGSLGIHRIGLESVQPLKNREYAAKGLPFIVSFKDYDFESKEYVYKVSNDENIIDISEIIAWYIKNNKNFSPNLIRESSKIFTWDIQMQKITTDIYEGEI